VCPIDAVAQDVAAWLTAHQQQQQSQQQQQQQQPVIQHPRFARVNTLKGNVQQVLAHLCSRSSNSSSSSSGRFDDVKVDDLLPDLLVFPAGTDLHDHALVTEGVLILQVGS
jgi:putative methyltransferase